MEKLLVPELEPQTEKVYTEITWRMDDIVRRSLQAEMGVVQTELVDVPVPGPHQLLVLDETVQPGQNFKYNGASYAVKRLAEERPGVQTVLTGTAGNFGGALAAAAQRLGLQTEIRAPKDLTDTKRQHMTRYGATIDDRYDDVLRAIEAAKDEAANTPSTAFIHPFNNLDAIAGQAMIGRRLVEDLPAKMAAAGRNVATDPVVILVQRGGGSLLAGVACAVQQLRETGQLGNNVQVHEVRPNLIKGRLDTRYDGLAVAEAGSYAQPLLSDKRFVQATTHISETDTGRAAHRMYRAFGQRFEPSGLAGVGAFEHESTHNPIPTTYVTVLSGANTTPERFADFMDAPRREQHELLTRTLIGRTGVETEMADTTLAARAASPSTTVWSGYQFR